MARSSLYPMLAPNRRLERRDEMLDGIADQGYRVTRLLDLTHHETAGRYLEGTGSVVFDHARAWHTPVCRRARDPAVLHELVQEIGYTPCTFNATDASGVPSITRT